MWRAVVRCWTLPQVVMAATLSSTKPAKMLGKACQGWGRRGQREFQGRLGDHVGEERKKILVVLGDAVF